MNEKLFWSWNWWFSAELYFEKKLKNWIDNCIANRNLPNLFRHRCILVRRFLFLWLINSWADCFWILPRFMKSFIYYFGWLIFSNNLDQIRFKNLNRSSVLDICSMPGRKKQELETILVDFLCNLVDFLVKELSRI